MINVDIDKLRTLLKFDGVVGEFTDEDLLILVETKMNELEGFTGINFHTNDKIKIAHNFKGKILELNQYPVLKIIDIFINDCPIKKREYNINYDLGIIYFKNFINGVVRVHYTVGFENKDFEYLIFPLLKDMIAYTISFGNSNRGLGGWGYLASSLKEGDVSINFSSGSTGEGQYGYTGSINNKIDELKKKYSCNARVRLI